MAFIGNLQSSGGDRRASVRYSTMLDASFRFILPLPLILTKMFEISDSGKALIRNISKGGILLEIPVTIKELSFLHGLSKSLEMTGTEKSWLLHVTDFSTIEVSLFSPKHGKQLTFFGLPVWARYIENSNNGGCVRIGLKFPERSDIGAGARFDDLKHLI